MRKTGVILAPSVSHFPTFPLIAHTDSSPSSQPDLPVKAPTIARSKCVNCGKILKTIPFVSGAFSCRECYGSDRYKRVVGTSIGSNSFTASAPGERE